MRTRSGLVAALLLLSLATPACGPARPMNGPSMNNRMNAPPPPSSPVVSTDVLRREPRANRTRVKHILVGWRELADSYGGRMDDRAAARAKADAEREVQSLLGQLGAGADFDALMRAHSEDTGLAANPDGYVVTPDAQLVLDFRRLGLRLDVGEVGVVETEFGFHVMKRVE
jgi:hypothetical protein